jgi:hypothetical protein
VNREQTRRECDALVAGLDIPWPFDLTALCVRVGEQRGKPVVLMATPMSLGSLCGMWMGTAKADYVFYEQDTTQLHQQHIVFHELGHILRRHAPKQVLGTDIARDLAPGVETGDIQRVLGRDTYDDRDEYEAELIATLLLQRIGEQATLGSARSTNEPDDAEARIERALRRPGRR